MASVTLKLCVRLYFCTLENVGYFPHISVLCLTYVRKRLETDLPSKCVTYFCQVTKDNPSAGLTTGYQTRSIQQAKQLS